tara:strand:- start:1956 stop:2276 length:321 start_codon:yes stop_codon:yes gene_type:complete
MKDFPQLDLNTLMLQMRILDDGDLEVFVGQNLPDDMSEEEAQFYSDLLNGLHMTLNTSVEHLIFIGQMLRTLAEEEEDELVFEPDEALLDAIADSKVVSINKKKLN